MSKNHLLLLDKIIEAEHASFKPEASPGEFFEFFSASRILRDYVIDAEEIEAGIVGQESNKGKKGSDGGIDAMYVMVGGEVVRDLEHAEKLNFEEPPRFEVICIQCTRDDTFEMARVIRMADSAKEIFDLSRTAFTESFNPKLLEIIAIFRASHEALLALHIALHVSFHFVTRGDTEGLNAQNNDTRKKAKDLESTLPKILRTIKKVTFEFVGDQELYGYAEKAVQPINHELQCYDSFGGAKGGEAIALVTIGELYNLITENDELREILFEWNVRDYKYGTTVNLSIRDTLEKEHQIPFWWLNNGITILVSKMTPVNARKIQITGPRIVNGLQTSQEVFRFIKGDLSKKGDGRLMVVRIIQSNDPETENRIIRATNCQNPMATEALRASDEVQKIIEDFFRIGGLHYDRRKNSWRKARRKRSEVVGISELAQSYGSVVLKEPDTARARLGSFFKPGKYEQVFNLKTPLKTYLFCAKLRKRMETFLAAKEPIPRNRTNLLFYCLTFVGLTLDRGEKPYCELDAASIPETMLEDALATVARIYITEGGDDHAARGTKMTAALKANFGEIKKTASESIYPPGMGKNEPKKPVSPK